MGFLWVAALASPFLAGVLVIHRVKEVPIAYLTQDPTVIGELAVYAGLLSSVGILFWWAGAAVCLFSAAVLARSGSAPALRSFLLAAGLLTALLALDDLFRLHESVLPRLLGVPELAVYAAYGALGAGFVLRFRAVAFAAEGRLLAFAVLCLGASVALDVLSPPAIDPYLLEDSSKFVGIVGWFVYFLRQSWLGLVEARRLQQRGHGRHATPLPPLRGSAAGGRRAAAPPGA
jgi:hypothetical protein